jgi:fumarate hydratase, class II
LLLAYREDLSLKDAALKLGYLAAEQKWGRSEDMTHPLTK